MSFHWDEEIAKGIEEGWIDRSFPDSEHTADPEAPGEDAVATRYRTFSWSDGHLFSVRESPEGWECAASICRFNGYADILLPVCIEALKRDGWSCVPPPEEG